MVGMDLFRLAFAGDGHVRNGICIGVWDRSLSHEVTGFDGRPFSLFDEG
jgi:hypothetical protein